MDKELNKLLKKHIKKELMASKGLKSGDFDDFDVDDVLDKVHESIKEVINGAAVQIKEVNKEESEMED